MKRNVLLSIRRLRSVFCSGVILIVLGLAGSALAERPNILFIYTDDQSDRTVSSYERAYPWVSTPHIDRLAETGVRFKNAYNGSWCMPARATFLTGKLTYGTESFRMAGPYPGSTYDPKQMPFWLDSFRKEGYTTAQIGKWHVGTDTGFGRDWDYQIVWNRPRYSENSGNYYYDQIIETNGGEGKLTKGYSTDNYTKWAKEYIGGKGRDANKPWLLWLCFGGTHGPFTPADRHMGTLSEDLEIPLPPDILGPRPGKPDYVKQRADFILGEDGQVHAAKMAGDTAYHASTRQYHETALSLDDAVGALIESLKETGQYENTLIVFTSDQGYAWGHHGFHTKVAPYDANIACPLIVSFPGRIGEGKVCDNPVGGQDLVPTLFSYAGIELPWEMHGRDLKPMLENPERPSDDPVVLTYTGRNCGTDTYPLPTERTELSGVAWWVSYRKGNFKYIVTLLPDETDELYDLDADPEELTNLAYYPEYRDTLKRYRSGLLAELRRTDCPFVDQVPMFFH